VWYLNGGDTLKSGAALRRVVEAMRADPSMGIAYAAVDLVRDGQYLYRQTPRLGYAPLWGINRVCHQALVFRRDLLLGLGSFDLQFPYAADYEVHLRALAGGAKMVAIPDVLAEYDMSGQSTRFRAVMDEMRLIHKHLQKKKLLPFPARHAAVLAWERARITAIKSLGETKLGPALRKIWVKWKRAGAS
jgi:GT2 family glycosyltransferase